MSTLTEEQQQGILQIMMENNETLTTDDKGFTEVDLGNCSAKTVQDVQTYIRQVKAAEAASEEQTPHGEQTQHLVAGLIEENLMTSVEKSINAHKAKNTGVGGDAAAAKDDDDEDDEEDDDEEEEEEAEEQVG